MSFSSVKTMRAVRDSGSHRFLDPLVSTAMCGLEAPDRFLQLKFESCIRGWRWVAIQPEPLEG
jgi:hypothetical protein